MSLKQYAPHLCLTFRDSRLLVFLQYLAFSVFSLGLLWRLALLQAVMAIVCMAAILFWPQKKQAGKSLFLLPDAHFRLKEQEQAVELVSAVYLFRYVIWFRGSTGAGVFVSKDMLPEAQWRALVRYMKVFNLI